MRHVALLALVTTACAAPVRSAPTDDALCADAVAHVEACVGESPALDVCDAAAAEQVLAMSCDDLGAAKADGFGSDVLCFFGFESFCGFTDETGRFTGHTLTGTVQRDVSLALASDIVATLRGGGVATTTITDQHGAFYFRNLATGTYELEVLDGGVVVHRRTLVVDGTFGILVFIPEAS